MSRLLCSPEVHYRVRKSPPLVPTLSHMHIYFPFPTSFQRILTISRSCVTFGNKVFFLRWGVVSPSPNPQSEGSHPLQAVRDCLFNIRECIQKFPYWADNEINNNNKHSLGSNTKRYGGKTHYTDSQNTDTTAPSGRELYHLQFSLQGASPETFGYILHI
jgi:hypothetical protein